MAGLKFDITGDNSAVLRAFKGVQDGVAQTAKVVEQQGQSIENVFSRIKSVASVAFAGFTAKEIISTLGTVRGEFQQFEIAFETMLGSGQKAKGMISDLANLAATTPFDMKGVVNGAKQLLAYGFAANEITDTMRRLGDVSAGLGLNLQDLTWLYGTTMVQGRLFTRDLMQFTGRGIPLTEELAKQFGVTKDKVSELVTAGKVGFPEVKKAIESLTNEGGKFGGLMEKQSHSITGQVSNIKDTIEMAINDLGTQTEGLMNDALDITSKVIDHWKEIGEVILAAASAIGLYKAMAVSVAAFDTATANVGYAAELSALDALLPKKEEVKKTDLEEAVAKGQLSAAQAELVASKREEVAAYVAELQTKAKVMQDEVHVLENKLALQDNEVQSLQDAYDALDDYVSAEVRDTAATNLNTAANERNNIANQLKAAREKAATAATNANTASQGLNTAATARDTATKGIWAQVTLLCEKAQRAWNASMFSSPLFLIAAAIVGVTYAVYKLATAETAHETAVRKSNEAWDEFDNKVKERQQNIESLIRTIQSETATEFEKAEAYQKLSNLAPQLTDQYDQAAIASLDFSKAQKEVAESMDESKYDKAVEDVKKYKDEVSKLQQLLSSDAKYNGGGQGILLSRQLETAEAALDRAEDRLNNIISLRNQAAENAKPIEVRLQEAQENESVRQEIFDFYDEAMTLANDWQSANETINYATGENRLDAFINKAQKEITELRDDIKKNPADLNLRMQESEKTKALNNLLAMKRNWEVTGATTIPLIFRAQWNTAKQALNQAKTKAQALANTGSTETYQQAYNKAQREYNAAKKKVAAMERNKSKYTASQYETATQDLKAAKDAYSKLGGDVSGKSAKAAVTARKNRIKEENRAIKVQEELNSRLKSLQQKNIDETISLMREGTEKKLKEIDNDYKKRLDEISKQEAEFKKKNKEAGKSSSLTKEQTDALSKAREIAKQNFDKQTAEVNKELLEKERDNLYEYLKEYGDIQQKKLAITKEYAEKISKAENAYQKASLANQRDNELQKLDTSDIFEQIDWENVFSDLTSHTKEYLVSLRSQLQKLIKSGKLTDVSDISKVQEKIDDLNAEISKQGGIFDFVGTKQLEQIRRINEAKEAQEALNSAKSKEADIENQYTKTLKQANYKATDLGVRAIGDSTLEIQSNLDKFGIDKNTKEYKEMSTLLTQLAILEGKLAKARKETAKATAEAKNKEDGAKVTTKDKVANWFSDAQEFITKSGIDQLPTLFSNLGMDGIAGKATQGLAAFNDAAGAAADFASGNFIGALSKGVSSLQNFTSVLGIGGDNTAKMQKKIDELNLRNDVLAKRLEELNDTLQSTNSITGAQDVYKEAVELIKTEEKNSSLAMIAEAKKHGTWRSSLNSSVEDNRIWKESMKQVSAILGKRITSSKDFLSLSAEEMKKIRDTDKDLFMAILNEYRKEGGKGGRSDKLPDMIQDYIDKYADAINDLTEQLKEKFTQMSFDDLENSFFDTLMDMSKDAEDFTDDFSKYLMRAVLKAKVGDLLDKDLKEFYDEWSKLAEDGLSQTEIDYLNKKYTDLVKKGLELRNEASKITGYTGEGTSQSATSGGWQSMGQETADELNGRFTALQIAGENISANMLTTVAQMETIVATGISTNGAVVEIRNMMIMTNSYLEDIVKYAKLTYNEFGTKIDDMNKRLKEI
ncbi:tape measure protein [Prevotella sp.]|uniref:tape measure protein n=1 Tax=Prevotella sp. TaxID=59823 RepID=UPI0027E3A996|nr:tape measure protein [Prevotella sp.]